MVGVDENDSEKATIERYPMKYYLRPNSLLTSVSCFPLGVYVHANFCVVGVSDLAERCMREKRRSSIHADCSGSKVITEPRQGKGITHWLSVVVHRN